MMKPGADKKYISQMYWLPSDVLHDRVKIDKIRYDLWHEGGLLRLCAGNCINYSDITSWFIDMVKVTGLNVAWVYYDSYSAKYWVQEMTAEGFRMERCIQAYKQTETEILCLLKINPQNSA